MSVVDKHDDYCKNQYKGSGTLAHESIENPLEKQEEHIFFTEEPLFWFFE